MTVIDLLNKIANGEEVPKKIKYINSIWKYDKETKDYFHNDLWLIYSMNSIGLTEREVEIIEEPQEHKIPEKLIPTSLRGIDNLDEKIEVAHVDTISAIDKINEIIDYLEVNNGIMD